MVVQCTRTCTGRVLIAGMVLAIFLPMPVSIPGSALARGTARERGNSVRIGVFGLFHPQQLEIEPVAGQALMLRVGNEVTVVEKSSGAGPVVMRLAGDSITIAAGTRNFQAASVVVSGRNGEPTDLILAIPGKISRRYHGTLEIRRSAGALLAILTLDRELAVAAIVAAESDSDAPLEALKAQAIVTRSYLVAGRGRHRDFDFCDTTHCQFLRDSPLPGSTVANAVADTRGLVLTYNSLPFPAMYTRSCSGTTRTPAQVGLTTAAYPYYAVECSYCRKHPQHWTSRLASDEASALKLSNERSRLEIDRRLGWSAVPSNDFVIREEGGRVLLSGAGNGHGIGLCQAGEKAMAESGASFRDILNHYYPNTTVINF